MEISYKFPWKCKQDEYEIGFGDEENWHQFEIINFSRSHKNPPILLLFQFILI